MIRYAPVIKATTAELTAIGHLEDSVKDFITPLFEIGKSRKTTKLPEGDVFRCFEQITSKFNGKNFILDLTSHPDLSNSQIENLFDESNGYSNWCDFIKQLNAPSLFPVVQIVADSAAGLANVTKQVAKLLQFSEKVVLRLPFLEPEAAKILSSVKSGLARSDQLAVIIDAGFLPIQLANKTAKEINLMLNTLKDDLVDHETIITSSSFPRAVNAAGYGGDTEGKFALEEVNLFSTVAQTNSALDLIYSDYGSIHPNRYTVRGGSWVPRIDMPLEDEIYYYRCRNKDNKKGYIEAASKVLAHPLYKSVGAWGNEQIQRAAAGHPAGRSPSYWIAVRANIHITTQANRIKQSLKQKKAA